MADFREVGIGVASALASKIARNPFPMAFKGQSLAEAGRIIMAILDECAAADVQIEKVELDPELCNHLLAEQGPDNRLVSNDELQGEVLIFRAAD